MSLNVYLEGPAETSACECVQCGNEHTKMTRPTYYAANYTHNCGTMAAAADIYEYIWRPDENGITTAAQLIEPLRAGIAAMKADPEKFRTFDPPNGWGSYATFLPWVEAYLAACEDHPDATVSVSR